MGTLYKIVLGIISIFCVVSILEYRTGIRIEPLHLTNVEMREFTAILFLMACVTTLSGFKVTLRRIKVSILTSIIGITLSFVLLLIYVPDGFYSPSVGTLLGFVHFFMIALISPYRIFQKAYWMYTIVWGISGIAILGHITGIPLMYYQSHYSTGMALTTAIIFCLLATIAFDSEYINHRKVIVALDITVT